MEEKYMVQKTNQIKLREVKESVFNVLKGLAPGLFGTKIWTDVESFGDDPEDTSKFIIIFKEET